VVQELLHLIVLPPGLDNVMIGKDGSVRRGKKARAESIDSQKRPPATDI